MKGCLTFIFKTIIAVLVFFGLLHLGIIDFIRDKIDENKGSSQEKIYEDTKDIIDLTEINDEYTIDKNLKILQNRMIVAEHNVTGQKMIMIEPKNGDFLTKEDIDEEDLQEKIEKLINKYRIVKFDKIQIVKKDTFKGVGQEIPYAKVKAEISSLPIKDIEGIVGVAELKNGKNLIVVSVNEKGKYSQIIAEAFYSQVK